MKKFTFWLPEGKQVTVQADDYELLLSEIDRFFDIFKEETAYYLGSSDESVIERAQDEDINFEVTEDFDASDSGDENE